jgi:hypothetical protein
MSTAATGTLTDKILEFCQILKALVRDANEHESLDETFWAPLTEFFDTDHFERMTADFSAFVPEEMAEAEGYDANAFAAQSLDWSAYMEVMSAWMLSPSQWDYTVLRIAELPNLVYVELQERVSATGQGDDYRSANSLSVYEFNEEGKIVRLRLGVADVALRVWPISSPSSDG